MNPGLIKNYTAGGVIAPNRYVMWGVTAGEVVQATAGARVCGICIQPGGVVQGQRVDVVRTGLMEVEFGGTVAPNDPLISDAQGRAVKATPAAGVNANLAGFADLPAVAGDIVPHIVTPSTMQGA